MAAIQKLWRLHETLKIIPVTDELFIFNFTIKEEMMKILKKQPWSIYVQILLLQHFTPGTPPQEVPLNTFSIWFSFNNLPYTYWPKTEIVELLQNVVTIDEISPQFSFPTTSVGYHIRANMSIVNPLLVGVDVVDEYSSLRMSKFLYENLPAMFSSSCKRIGHRPSNYPFT